MVRPMHKTALIVPDVFSVKSDLVALPQIVDPRSKLDIVLDQDGLSRGEPNYKSLVW